MKRFFQFAVSLIVGGVLLYFVLRRFDLTHTTAALRQADPALLGLGLALMVAAYLLRGLRWRIWESSLTYWDSLRLILIGFMGNNVLPARLGELLRAHCAASKMERGRGRTAALASIAAERILDGLVLAVFGLVGMALLPIEERLRLSLFFVSLVFAALASALVLSIHLHKTILSWISGAHRRFPGRVTAFIEDKATHLLNGLLPLGTWSRMLTSIAVTAVIWAIELCSYYFLGSAVWSGMTPRIALLFLVVVNFASLIPLTIGGIGTIEAVALTFLTSCGVSPYPALAMILLQHAGQYFFTTISGGVLYLAGGFYRVPLVRPQTDRDDTDGPGTNLPEIDRPGNGRRGDKQSESDSALAQRLSERSAF